MFWPPSNTVVSKEKGVSHLFPPTSLQGSDAEHLILTLTHEIDLDWMHVEIQKPGVLLKRASAAVIFTPT